MANEPDWDALARIDGLPVTNWKWRSGYSAAGTVGQLIQRWLSLPYNIKMECSLGWGDASGKRGVMGGDEIASYVRRHGLPPAMAAARACPATQEEIEAMLSKPVWREGPPQDRGHSVP
jgi:hypothetical protein